ncbi:MAG: ABC transporter substrate-binding protein [Synechococcales bacterium]|nr:ABC transporter substrate-binding protein [Synechococcales bacterium]
MLKSKRRSMLKPMRMLAIALVLLGAIATSSCSLNWFRTEAAQVPRLVYSELSEPKTFNPVTSQEATVIFGLIYEGLLSENGLTGELEPALAESWEISEDQKRIEFTLREGLAWSDGEPFTVDDILFTYNDVYFNPGIPSGEADILRVGDAGAFPEVRKLDERHVEFTVPEPFAPFLRYAGGISILPKHVLEPYVTETDAEGNPRFLSTWGTDTNPENIVGNGPYRLVSYVPSQRIIFERNPHYWRRDAAGTSQPYIDRFVVQIVESTDASFLQFRSGGLDVISVSPENFALLKREEERGNFTIYEDGPRPGTNFISFNLNQGRREGKPLVDPVKSRWFNTLEFRQAIAYAINRQAMINNLYQGLGEPQHSPISVQSPYYLSPEEGLKTYDYNLDKARERLTQAGFQYASNGQLQDAEGNAVRFTLITNAGNKLREAMGAQIKQDLSKIGIQVDFQPIAFNTLVDKLSNTLDWECFLLGLTGGVEPNSGANVWRPDGTLHSFNQAPPPDAPPLEGRIIYDWEAEIGRLYVQAAQELDEEERKALYAQTQQITQEYLPFIYLVNPLSLGAVRNRVAGVQYSALGGVLWNVQELQLTEQ